MWCATCYENKTDHPSMCTTCGEPLLEQQQQEHSRTSSSASASNRNTINSLLQNLNSENTNNWQEIPAELLDPQNTANSNNNKYRATSKEFISRIPRITLTQKSFVMYDALVEIYINSQITKTCHATIAELHLACTPPYSMTKASIAPISLFDENKTAIATIAYFKRGGGKTFKSMIQETSNVGAKAMIVGNNSSAWPYIMKDSAKASYQNIASLDIPAVMIKRSDGNYLEQQMLNNSAALQISITATPSKEGTECVICRESYKTNEKIIRLPGCFHVFHEKCALFWLEKHNTCPTCRKELPTDDKEYEMERRRVSRTHAGSDGNNMDHNWESMFG